MKTQKNIFIALLMISINIMAIGQNSQTGVKEESISFSRGDAT